MIELLKDKKVIFFDVGYTLDYPLSGDWMFTKKFYELVGDKLNKYSSDEIQRARDKGLEYLEKIIYAQLLKMNIVNLSIIIWKSQVILLLT